MPDMNFTPAQAAAIAHRGGALLISAGAGSGKTRVLIERLMGLMDEGHDIDRFLVITYTRAAAAELKSRLSAAIGKRLAERPDDRVMRRQANLIYRARIGTIHSFCSDMIRESAHLVGVKPGFRQLDEVEAKALLSERLSELLDRRYEECSEAFCALTDMLGAGRDDSKLVEIALDTYAAVQSHPDPTAWMLERINTPVPDCGAEDTIWGSAIMSEVRQSAEYWLDKMELCLSDVEADPGIKKAYFASWSETVQSLRGYLAALDEGWDAALGYGEISFPRVSGVRGRSDDIEVCAVKAIREACKTAMKRACARIDTESAGLMEDMTKLKSVTDELYRLVIDLIADYGEEKKRRGVLDFADLEHLSLKILVREDGTPTARAEEISRRFDEILVDEYQDVNRVQELIFSAVSRGGRNITMVGDVKQSIYRFRLADPTIFLDKYNSFPDAPAPEGEPSRILMAHNFRSRPEILEVVNFVFARLMSPRLGEMAYGETERMLPGRTDEAAFEEPFELCLCINGEDMTTAEYEAACAAEYIYKTIASGAEIDGRPIEASDFAILLRSFRSKAEIYASALRERGIPCSAGGGTSGLFDGWENRLLLQILRIIDNPMQDIPLIGVLKSPVCGLTADELAMIRAADRAGDFYSALCARAETDEKCGAFLSALSELRMSAAELDAAAMVDLVLEKTGLAALAEARERGSSERLFLVSDYARSCEVAGCAGLYGFLRRIDASEAPGAKAAAAGGVSIMSIHASKGLEFPVVLLCDLVHGFNKMDSRRPVLIHRDLGAGAKFRDLERGIEYPSLARTAIAALQNRETLSEEMRILYVAMTRAREKLVCVCSLRSEAQLDRQLVYFSDGPDPELLAAQNSMGDWLMNALLGMPGYKYTVLTPGGGEMSAGEEAPERPKPDKELIGAIRESLSWRGGGDSEGLPSKITATSLKSGFLAAEAAEDAGELPSVKDTRRDIMRRPAFVSGAEGLSPGERGTALHKAMQLVSFSRCGSLEEIKGEIDRMRAMRLLSEAEADSVSAEKIFAFFRSELGRRVLRAENLRREFKFSVLVPAREIYGRGTGDVLLQGVVDLFFEEEGVVVIVDFKSDRIKKSEREQRAGEYSGQLRAYSEALKRITGKEIREARLYFFECDGE